jgi:hypothetical protein
LLAQLVPQASKVQLDSLARLVLKALVELRGHKAQLALKEQLALLELLVPLECKDRLELRD